MSVVVEDDNSDVESSVLVVVFPWNLIEVVDAVEVVGNLELDDSAVVGKLVTDDCQLFHWCDCESSTEGFQFDHCCVGIACNTGCEALVAVP